PRRHVTAVAELTATGAPAEAEAEAKALIEAESSDEARTDLVRVRRRGAGTELAPNA
ncbi:biotin synthase BioB, partial [Kitasatospora sp. NPDC007106]